MNLNLLGNTYSLEEGSRWEEVHDRLEGHFFFFGWAEFGLMLV